MPKDPRYSTIKILIEAGRITSFREIFVFIPKTIVYHDLGMNFNRFDNSIANPSLFRMKELIRLAEMFEIEPKKIIDMAYEQSIKTIGIERKNINASE